MTLPGYAAGRLGRRPIFSAHMVGQGINTELLRTLIRKKRLLKGDFARKINITPNGFSRILRTGRTTQATLSRIAAELDVPLDRLRKVPEAEPQGESEIELLERFRRLSPVQRGRVLGYVERLAGEAE